MSELSTLADELRKMADELRHIHVDDSSVGLLFAAMGAMREAADTIDRLQAFQSVSVSPLAMDRLADRLREANETIVWLREKLQELRDVGGGECEAIHDKDYYKGIHGYCEGLKCSNCGEPLFSEFGFCPWCGARIRKAAERCAITARTAS